MKHSLEETIRINKLLEIYGRFLTKSQFEVMVDYFENNLSLAEISEIRNISRTAVSDAINQATNKLENCEEKLGLCKIFDSLKEKGEDVSKVIDEIIEMIKDGI